MFSKQLARLSLTSATVALLAGGLIPSHAQATPLNINFYYAVAVGGPLPQVFQKFAADFNAANPDVHVTTVNSGGYSDIYKAIDTQIKGGATGPDVAILLSTDMNSLIDNDYIVPLDSFIKGSKEADTYLKSFFPAFLLNSQYQDRRGAHRSSAARRSCTTMPTCSRRLASTRPKPGQLERTAGRFAKADQDRWQPVGNRDPVRWFPILAVPGFAIGNGQNLVGDTATQVYFNSPSNVQALQYLVDLQGKYAVMPKGIIKWNDTPTDFTSGKTAMVIYTTGGLTNILKNAKFNVGVGFIPAGAKGYGAPTGGGNLYIMKTAPTANQAAAWRWVEYLTSPAIQADWTVASGYIATRQEAWTTDALKTLTTAHPQYLVARDQLQYAQKELTAHQGADVQQIMGLAIQAALTGQKTPQQALDDAQKAADKLLSAYPADAPATMSAAATMSATMAATAAQ